jgi:hypothetical protein
MKKQIIISTLLVLGLLMGTISLGMAAPPDMRDVHFEVHIVDDWSCDFPIALDFVFDAREKFFYNEEGELIRFQAHVDRQGTLTNLETGLTLRDPGHSTVFIDMVEGTQTVVGLNWNINVPGEGVVVLDVGRLVFDLYTGDILFEAGPHQLRGEGPTWLCDVLS